MEDCQPGMLRAGRNEQVGQWHGAVLGALGELRLNFQCAIDDGVIDGSAWHSAQSLGEGFVVRGTGGAVEQLQVDDPAGGDLSVQQEGVQRLANLGSSLSPGQGALVGEEGGHYYCSAPGAGHDIGIVELERAGSG